MLVSSVSIAVKLALVVHSKHELTQVSSKGGEKGGGTSGSGREMQAAITVCTMALMQCLAYFPTAAICMAFCLANESPQFELVRFSFNNLQWPLFWLCMELICEYRIIFTMLCSIYRTTRTSTRSSLWATTWPVSPSQWRISGTSTFTCSAYVFFYFQSYSADSHVYRHISSNLLCLKQPATPALTATGALVPRVCVALVALRATLWGRLASPEQQLRATGEYKYNSVFLELWAYEYFSRFGTRFTHLFTRTFETLIFNTIHWVVFARALLWSIIDLSRGSPQNMFLYVLSTALTIYLTRWLFHCTMHYPLHPPFNEAGTHVCNRVLLTSTMCWIE